MEILILNKSNKFDEYVKPYESNIKPFLQDFHKEIKKGGSPVGLHPLIQGYSVYLKWPTRKLEYSYVLNQCLPSLKSGCKVLEAGCGVTPLVRFFARSGYQAYGVDKDPETIELLTIKDSKLYDPLVSYSCQDLTRLDFPDESFDIVTCVSVLEHLRVGEDTESVGEMLRVLKKGGRLIIVVDFIPTPSFTQRALRYPRLLLSGNPIQIFKRIIKIIRKISGRSLMKERLGGCYDIKNVYRRLIDPFGNALEGDRIREVNLSPEDVRQFWKSHWLEGYLFDDNIRYVSLGFVLKKQ